MAEGNNKNKNNANTNTDTSTNTDTNTNTNINIKKNRSDCHKKNFGEDLRGIVLTMLGMTLEEGEFSHTVLRKMLGEPVPGRYLGSAGRCASESEEPDTISGNRSSLYTDREGRRASESEEPDTISGNRSSLYTDREGRRASESEEPDTISGNRSSLYTDRAGRRVSKSERGTVEGHYLSRSEKSFAARLYLGVLERLIYIDYCIGKISVTPREKMRPVVLNILRMGVYQMFFMDSVPDRAAVYEAGVLVEKRGFKELVPFVNGVLRGVQKESRERLESEMPENVKLSVPKWMFEKVSAQFSKESARAFFKGALENDARLTIRLNTAKKTENEIIKIMENEGCVLKPADERGDSYFLEAPGTFTKLKSFTCGLFSVQDASSVRAALAGCRALERFCGTASSVGIFGNSTSIGAPGDGVCGGTSGIATSGCASGNRQSDGIPRTASSIGAPGDGTSGGISGIATSGCASGNRQSGGIPRAARGVHPVIIDVCAAPGGKSICCAQYFPEARIVSRDISEYKTGLIEENIRRLGLGNIETQLYDARKFDISLEGAADLVIADLPCSGIGVIGRKPDIKFRLREKDLDSLVSLQRSILDACAGYLKEGGILLYSTCTVNRDENNGNAKWFAKTYNFEIVESEQIMNAGKDGFYICVMRRRSSRKM